MMMMWEVDEFGFAAGEIKAEKKDAQFLENEERSESLFRRGRILGDRLGAFRDGVLGQFTGKNESHRGLDLTRRDSRLLVVGSKLGGFCGNTLEDIYRDALDARFSGKLRV